MAPEDNTQLKTAWEEYVKRHPDIPHSTLRHWWLHELGSAGRLAFEQSLGYTSDSGIH